jgi:hypothetical protein
MYSLLSRWWDCLLKSAPLQTFNIAFENLYSLHDFLASPYAAALALMHPTGAYDGVEHISDGEFLFFQLNAAFYIFLVNQGL